MTPKISRLVGLRIAGELLINVSVAPATSVTKLNKGEPLPPNNFLQAQFQGKPYRNYRLRYHVDPSKMSFTLTSDGIHHGQISYAVVVYSPEGMVVNSLLSSTEVEMDDATFEKAMSL